MALFSLEILFKDKPKDHVFLFKKMKHYLKAVLKKTASNVIQVFWSQKIFNTLEDLGKISSTEKDNKSHLITIIAFKGLMWMEEKPMVLWNGQL
mgnify:CR=1 FL=1